MKVLGLITNSLENFFKGEILQHVGQPRKDKPSGTLLI